jgi:hypothetical protein
MQEAIKSCLDTLKFGDNQAYHHITVIPLHGAANGAPPYIALADAMGAKTLTVTEVSEGGSVPELLVTNESDLPVLIIDGEELLGAKQNRILNTTILLKEHSRTKVPVSCTEQGRWAYASAHFSISEAMLERKIRSSKSRSVRESLAREGTHRSDQGEVWDGIHALHAKANLASPTSAMADAFKARQAQLDECLKAFRRQEGQVGLMVLIGGRVAGLDLVSRPEVYARLHDKLVRSYILDALLERPGKPAESADPSVPPTSCVAGSDQAAARSPAQPCGSGDAHATARAFLASAEAAKEEVFPSVSYGRDHRYDADGVTGSALVHEGKLIHAAFLRVDEPQQRGETSSMASLRRRRHYRLD